MRVTKKERELPHFERLKVLRVRLGLTQAELSRRTSINQAALSGIESGSVPLGQTRQKKLEKALGLKVGALCA